MTAKPLVIITTELPPAVCGIGTYSWNLRRHWPSDSRAVQFVVREKGSAATSTALGDRLTEFHGDGDALAQELARIGDADVLVHWAPRAYHALGFPRGMTRAITSWKRKHAGARLLLFVHELPAVMPVTSRHFWFGQLSNHLTRKISACADILLTNTPHHRDELRKLTGREDIHLLPIGSNIAPLAKDDDARAPGEFVIFGRPFSRLQTLRLFESHTSRWVERGFLQKLHLVGPQDEKFSVEADELLRPYADRVVDHGEVAEDKVARVLRRAQFALTNASAATWEKATVVMACVANQCPVVIASERPASGPFSSAIAADEVERISLAEVEARSAAFAEWYHANADWPIIGARLAAIAG